MLKKLSKDKKGFTLAELLIVVAIIAVLVAISIPIFSAQLHKSRRAVDEANARSLYANLQADYLTCADDGTSYSAASWSAALTNGATFNGAGTTFLLQDGETVALKDDDTTITLKFTAPSTSSDAEGWGVTFKCAQYDTTAIQWGVN